MLMDFEMKPISLSKWSNYPNSIHEKNQAPRYLRKKTLELSVKKNLNT